MPNERLRGFTNLRIVFNRVTGQLAQFAQVGLG
jgi:hypothetical protein